MTNATVLADALVEAGIIQELNLTEHSTVFMVGSDSLVDPITDWRVAGACLKAWPTTINTENLDMTLDEMLRDPAAICEGFVQAIEARQ